MASAECKQLVVRAALDDPASRACCLTCVVASPRLQDVNYRTVEQMRLVNALCRFVELADER